MEATQQHTLRILIEHKGSTKFTTLDRRLRNIFRNKIRWNEHPEGDVSMTSHSLGMNGTKTAFVWEGTFMVSGLPELEPFLLKKLPKTVTVTWDGKPVAVRPVRAMPIRRA